MNRIDKSDLKRIEILIDTYSIDKEETFKVFDKLSDVEQQLYLLILNAWNNYKKSKKDDMCNTYKILHNLYDTISDVKVPNKKYCFEEYFNNDELTKFNSIWIDEILKDKEETLEEIKKFLKEIVGEK